MARSRPHPIEASPAALPWRRRRQAILLGAFLLVALTVGAAQIVAAVRAYRRAEAAAVTAHVETARALARATELFFARYLDIAETASRAAFANPLADDERRRLLASIRQAHPEAAGIYVIDPAGRITDGDPRGAVGIDVSDRAGYRQVLAGVSPVLSDLVIGKDTRGLNVSVVDAAREPDGRLRGMVWLDLPAALLQRELGIRLGNGAFPLIVDRTGRVVVRGEFPELDWASRDVSRAPLVGEALAGSAVRAGRFVSPLTGQAMLGAMVQVPKLGWVVGAVQPADAALAPARHELRLALATTAVVLALAAALSFVLSASLSRPLAALAAGLAALGRGDLTHRVMVRSRGELGRFVDHFNAMAARLEEARRHEQALVDEARAAQQRAAFLAEASTRIASSLDYEATLRSVARLAVPVLADGCLIDLVETDQPRQVAVAHADPDDEALLRELQRFPLDPNGSHLAAVALRTGQPQLLAEVTDGWSLAVSHGAEHFEILRRLAIASYMCVPLVARERTLGTLSLVSSRSGRRYSPADLRLAEDLAQRAAFAVDNARLFRAAQEAIRQAQIAIRARDIFLARASHELRTPLTSALGSIRMLRKAMAGTLPDAPDYLIGIASRNLETMASLINDLLDASKLTAGRETLTLAPVDLGAAVGASLDVVGAQARDKGVALRVAVPPGLVLPADRLKLEQVLTNLLANAVKFTPPGGEIGIEAEADGDGVLVRVKDTGEGIAREHLERIFEPFFQVDSRKGRRPRGTGLGLAICQQIIELHGGRIWAESEGLGRGSRFILRLPAARADGRAA